MIDLSDKAKILKELKSIPGVGIKTAEDFWDLGIYQISDLHNKDPLQMYHDLCRLKQQKLDRCVLYVFRCAVYFAKEKTHDPEKLKWWYWKDHEL